MLTGIEVPSPCADAVRSDAIIVSFLGASFPSFHPARSHDSALAACLRLIRILCLLNLCDQLFKGLSDILIIASTRFSPSALQLLREFLAFLCSNLALLRTKITLVANDDNRKPLNTLDAGR